MERTTNQKQIILNFLQSVKTHPTAEDIYTEVKKDLPRISMGTVYRNLEYFTKKGEIKKIYGEVKRFDGDISPHHHFSCLECKKIFDIFENNENNTFNKIIKKAKKIGNIKNYQICFSGICKKCQK